MYTGTSMCRAPDRYRLVLSEGRPNPNVRQLLVLKKSSGKESLKSLLAAQSLARIMAILSLVTVLTALAKSELRSRKALQADIIGFLDRSPQASSRV